MLNFLPRRLFRPTSFPQTSCTRNSHLVFCRKGMGFSPWTDQGVAWQELAMTCCHLLETPTDIQTDEYLWSPKSPSLPGIKSGGTASEEGFGGDLAESMQCPHLLNRTLSDCQRAVLFLKNYICIYLSYSLLCLFFPHLYSAIGLSCLSSPGITYPFSNLYL